VESLGVLAGAFERARHAPVILDPHDLRAAPALLGVLGDRLRLIRLASEADHHDRADVRVGRSAGQHALGQHQVVANLAAPVLVGDQHERRAGTVEALHHGVRADHRR
jgi:hypothetical protein